MEDHAHETQELGLSSPARVTGVVIPHKPPVDKIVAMVFLQNHLVGDLETIQYWKSNECSDEQFARCEGEGKLPIDLGSQKYHKAGAMSASEYVADTHNLTLSRGERRLLELVNDNNRRGSLKNHLHAVPQTLRDMYELADGEQEHLMIINAAADVIQSYIAVQDAEVRDDIGEAQIVSGMPPELLSLRVELQGCNDHPMTAGRYLRDLWILNTPVEQIIEKVDFWLKGKKDVSEAWDRAAADFEHAERYYKRFPVGGFAGLVIPTGDRFLVKYAATVRDDSGRPKYPIRLILEPDGHMVVSTSKLDLSALAAELERREPGLWYYQAAMGAVMNGSTQYIDVPTTQLKRDQMITLIQMFPPKRPEKKR